MCIFLIVDIILFFLFLTYNSKNAKRYFTISSLLLLMLTGLNNGTAHYFLDLSRYVDLFMGKGDSGYGNLDVKNGYDLEPIFGYFVRILRIFGRYDFVYIMGTALCFGVPFLYLVKKYSSNPPLSILLLLIILNTNIYVFFLAAHRQMLATTFFILAYILYMSKEFKYRKCLIAIFLILSLFSHSSSYLVLPLILLFHYLKLWSKKQIYWFLGISIVLGLTIVNVFDELVHSLMSYLSVFEVLDRVTSYTNEDVSKNADISLNSLLPLTLFTALIVYYSNKKECESFFVKSLVFATILKNLFGFIPLISRGILFFILIAISCAIPSALINNKECKNRMTVITILMIYFAYKAYSSPNCLILPYTFIFE